MITKRKRQQKDIEVLASFDTTKWIAYGFLAAAGMVVVAVGVLFHAHIF